MGTALSDRTSKQLSEKEKENLLKILRARFLKNQHRHSGMQWDNISLKLEGNPLKLWSLNEMEMTGGEPDVVDFNKKTGEYTLIDCSPESPSGRRSLCYDREALDSRKENKPVNSAMDMADEMGIEILTEASYRELQKLGEFDTKTSSWLITPEEIRKLGGAIFGDRRYNHVFMYHNSASSYYAARGFRGSIKI